MIGADEALIAAREAAYRALLEVEHYSQIARMHLQFADDPCALMALADMRLRLVEAIREFVPIRAAMSAAAPERQASAA